MKKKIFIISSSRADFGLLKNLVYELKKNINFKTYLVVTGSHLLKRNGNTISEVKQSGIKIFKKIKIYNNSSDQILSLTKAFNLGIVKNLKLFLYHKPDLVIILGDRYEIFSVAIACYFNGIKIAHIQGGESTEGAIDEQIRHSITKLSYYHFVTLEKYRKRVIQMGENPNRVFNVGALAADSIKNNILYSKEEISKKLKINFKNKFLIIALYPETNSRISSEKLIRNLLKVLSSLKNTTLIFNIPGVDFKYNEILSLIKEFVKKHNNAFLCNSLGQRLFLSCLKIADGIVGNSSSGIYEMPYFKKGTVNIGSRQQGRIQMKSIINTDLDPANIRIAIKKLYSKGFNKKIVTQKYIYGKGDAAKKISKILSGFTNPFSLHKKFYDLK
jgi:GDP/UDP-N,N'-diacetylbacillosamine 2-epimerase (hydrolysing)